MKKNVYSIVVAFISSVLFITLLFSSLLVSLEGRIDDYLAKLTAEPGKKTDNVAVILLDQKSLDWAEDTMGLSWPWPREIYGALTAFLEQGGAKAAGFDVIFSENSFYGPEDDESFAYALKSFSRAVGTVFLSDQNGETTWPSDIPEPAFSDLQISGADLLKEVSHAQFPIHVLAEAFDSLANVQISADRDGIFRRVPPAMIFDGKTVPSMALALLGSGGGSFNRSAVADRNGNYLLRFRGPSGTHPTYNAAEVIRSEIQILSGEEPQLDPGVFKDKYVLFGFSAPGLMDLRPSPMNEIYAGVEIHATMLDNFLSGDFRIPVPGSSSLWNLLAAAMVVFFSFAAVFGVTKTGSAAKSIFVYAAAIILPPLTAGLFWTGNLAMPVLPVFGASALSLIGGGIINYATEGRQKRFIKNAFSQYLSPAVINQLLQDPSRLRLGGERRDLTIFFSDLQGFTTISEGLDPEALTLLLNTYLTEMAKVIKEEGGTIDKYEGDAIIAFWNAPIDQADHAARGVRALLKCQKVLEDMRPELEKMSNGKPVLMRIGMNSGPAVVGNMGSVDRFDYTMLGDSVNLAARLEGVNKQFGTYSMISKATLDSARLSGMEVFARELARVEVVGKSEPVTVYEPMFREQHEEKKKIFERFNIALYLFYEGKFKEAAEIFAELASEDPASEKYLAKIKSMNYTPPENWKGVWVMTSK